MATMSLRLDTEVTMRREKFWHEKEKNVDIIKNPNL